MPWLPACTPGQVPLQPLPLSRAWSQKCPHIARWAHDLLLAGSLCALGQSVCQNHSSRPSHMFAEPSQPPAGSHGLIRPVVLPTHLHREAECSQHAPCSPALLIGMKQTLAKKSSLDWRTRRPRAMLAASLGSRREMSSLRVRPRVSWASSTVRSRPGRPCTPPSRGPSQQLLCCRSDLAQVLPHLLPMT